MKKLSTFFSKSQKMALILSLSLPFATQSQSLLVQDFSGGANVAAFTGTGANQFDYIGVSAPSSSNYSAANNGKLTFQKYSGSAVLAKSTNLSSTAPSLLKIKFKVNVPYNTAITAVNTGAVIYIGSSGFVAGTTTTGEVRHSSLGIGFGSSGKFYLRNLIAFTQTDTLIGEQQVTWFVNNSGASISYVDPAGGSSTLDDDKHDVWVGTTRVFSAIAAITPTADINNFKVLFNGASSHGAIAFDDFDFSTGTVALPVSFSGFKASVDGSSNTLTWTTASEINNKGFFVQRQSLNSGVWENLGFVNGNNTASTYTFKDNNPLKNSYYRLKQVDLDGKESFSSVVNVNQKANNRIVVGPNPASNTVTVNLSKTFTANETVTATLFDLYGKKVLVQNSKVGTFNLDISNLSKGTYILNVQSKGETFNEKIVKK